MMSLDHFVTVKGNVLRPARSPFISLHIPSVSWGLYLSDRVPFCLLFKAREFLPYWKVFYNINVTITDCHVARMTWRLKAAEIQFFESVFHSYTPNLFNAGSTTHQQAQTQEQRGTFPCKIHL